MIACALYGHTWRIINMPVDTECRRVFGDSASALSQRFIMNGFVDDFMHVNTITEE